MNRELEETFYKDFVTTNPYTGAVTDADSLPTCEIFEETNDAPILTPTVVKRTNKVGNYYVPIVCTTGNGFEVGKSYSIIISATVSSVTSKAAIEDFQARTTANQNADALLDRINGIEVNMTFREAMRALVAFVSGISQGGATAQIIFKAPNGTTDRIQMTVNPTTGERTAVVLTL